MVGRRNRESGKGFSSFISIVLLAFVTVVATQLYPRIQRNKQYTQALNTVRADFSSQKWDAAIKGYNKLWEEYPDKDKADQYNVAAAHENWATELYEGSLRTRTNWNQAATQFELAAVHRPLSEQSLMALGDCYVETGQLDKVKGLLIEAERRGDVDLKKFGVLRKRLEKATGAPK